MNEKEALNILSTLKGEQNDHTDLVNLLIKSAIDPVKLLNFVAEVKYQLPENKSHLIDVINNPEILVMWQSTKTDNSDEMNSYLESVTPLKISTLIKSIKVLNKVGFTAEDREKAYLETIKNNYTAEMLTSCFEPLQRAGISFAHNQELYLTAIQEYRRSYNYNFRNELFLGFKALQDAGFNSIDNKKLFLNMVSSAYIGDEVASKFKSFQEAQSLFSLKENEDICLILLSRTIKNFETNKLKLAMKALQDAGFNANDKNIFLNFLSNVEDIDQALACFKIIRDCGLDPKENKSLHLLAIENLNTIDTLLSAFSTLEEAGFTPQNNKDFYIEIAKRSFNTTRIAQGFQMLKKAGFNSQDNSDLYLAVIKRPPSPENQLPLIFEELKDIGFSLKDNKDLYLVTVDYLFLDTTMKCIELFKKEGFTSKDKDIYMEVLKKPSNHTNYLRCIPLLKSAGANPTDHKDLYVEIIKNNGNIGNIEKDFQLLKSDGFTIKDNKELYLSVIQNYFPTNNLPAAFKKLHDEGFTFEKNKDLYLALIKQRGTKKFDTTTIVFETMKSMGANPTNNNDLYSFAFKNLENFVSEAKPTMESLQKSGFNLSNDVKYYEAAINHSTLANYIFPKLGALGLDKQSHNNLYQLFFTDSSQKALQPRTLSSKMITALTEYLQKTPPLKLGEPGYESQSTTLQQLLSNIIANESQLAEGPLNKSTETKELERILEKMANTAIEDMTMSFDPSHGYMLNFKNEPSIYINHLLDQVNFNHLELSNTLIEKIGNKIISISADFQINFESKYQEIQKLPKVAQTALSFYIGDRCYKNMNRLFRGMPQTSEEKYTWIKPVDGKENLLANFLCGCLVNWSAKELPLNYLKAHDGEIPEQGQNILNRGENLTGTDELATTTRRLANPVISPAVTSVSAHKKGSPYFLKENTTRTIFESFNTTRPIINYKEGEQLIPHGTSFVYAKNPDGGFIAKEVNSPDITPHGSYWLSMALSYAYEKHLKKAYEDSPSDTIVGGITIQRPNHGLAHTERVMTHIQTVIDYFARHAQDEEFRLFCNYISDKEKEWLGIAAVFSITGRESEIAAVENLDQYDKYRQKSQEHLSDFLKEHPPQEADDAMQERILHIVRYMGNPAYEKGTNEKTALNQHADEMEQKHRNFLHRILTIAHKLDLPRCYEPEKVEAAMQSCRTLSHPSAKQETDFKQMLSYSIDLIKAHGNALKTGITTDGKLVTQKQNYQPPFERVSHNMRDLQTMTDTVTRNIFTEKTAEQTQGQQALLKPILKMCGYREVDADTLSGSAEAEASPRPNNLKNH